MLFFKIFSGGQILCYYEIYFNVINNNFSIFQALMNNTMYATIALVYVSAVKLLCRVKAN